MGWEDCLVGESPAGAQSLAQSLEPKPAPVPGRQSSQTASGPGAGLACPCPGHSARSPQTSRQGQGWGSVPVTPLASCPLSPLLAPTVHLPLMRRGPSEEGCGCLGAPHPGPHPPTPWRGILATWALALAHSPGHSGRDGARPRTCDGVVALQSQRVVLAGAGAHQVEAAPAAGRREVADVLEGRADGRPGVRVGVVALHLHHVQRGTCGGWGSGLQGRGRGPVAGHAGSEAPEGPPGSRGCPSRGRDQGGCGLERQVTFCREGPQGPERRGCLPMST